MQYLEVKSSEIPLDLLLEADPSEANIASYLSDSWCFASLDNGRVLAACIVKPQTNNLAEIFNVSVSPELQGNGIGSELLKLVLSKLPSKVLKSGSQRSVLLLQAGLVFMAQCLDKVSAMSTP